MKKLKLITSGMRMTKLKSNLFIINKKICIHYKMKILFIYNRKSFLKPNKD